LASSENELVTVIICNANLYAGIAECNWKKNELGKGEVETAGGRRQTANGRRQTADGKRHTADGKRHAADWHPMGKTPGCFTEYGPSDAY